MTGAFCVLLAFEQSADRDRFSSLSGFACREPLLAFCMMIFILSLAGIPPLAGFFGKFYLFAAALNSTSGSTGLLWLVIVAIAMSTVSLYYYLQVLKQIYVRPAAEGFLPVRSPLSLRTLAALIAACLLALGFAPNLFLNKAHLAAAVIGR